MAVTATTIRAREIYGTIEGDTGVFPRDSGHLAFRKYAAFAQRHIYGDGDRYLAFPVGELVGTSIVGIFSSGPVHAGSDRQIMFVYDPAADSIATAVFVTDAAPTSFNTTLLDPLMSNGDVLNLKIWTLVKASGIITVTSQSSQTEGGADYAFWNAPKIRPSTSTWFRTGYGGGKAGLFSSPDGKAPWTFVGDLFRDAGKVFTETDICWRADGTMLAVCRETSGGSSGGNIYWTTATGAGTSPAAATLYTNALINGVQPQLRTLADGKVLLMTSDRTGTSGTSGESSLYGGDTTGIAAWLLPSASTAAEGNWGFRQMLDGIYSTDGGQPWPVILASGEAVVPYYARRSARAEPNLYLMRFDPTKF